MVKIETKQGNITLPKYMWNDLRDDAKTLRLNTVSDLIYKYVKEGRANEDIVPMHLKIANAKDAIGVKLDSILASRNCAVDGSLVLKFDNAMCLASSYGNSNGVQNTKSSYEISLYDLFEELKQVDLDEYKIIYSKLLKYTTLKRKYVKYCNMLSGQSTL